MKCFLLIIAFVFLPLSASAFNDPFAITPGFSFSRYADGSTNVIGSWTLSTQVDDLGSRVFSLTRDPSQIYNRILVDLSAYDDGSGNMLVSVYSGFHISPAAGGLYTFSADHHYIYSVSPTDIPLSPIMSLSAFSAQFVAGPTPFSLDWSALFGRLMAFLSDAIIPALSIAGLLLGAQLAWKLMYRLTS